MQEYKSDEFINNIYSSYGPIIGGACKNTNNYIKKNLIDNIIENSIENSIKKSVEESIENSIKKSVEESIKKVVKSTNSFVPIINSVIGGTVKELNNNISYQSLEKQIDNTGLHISSETTNLLNKKSTSNFFGNSEEGKIFKYTIKIFK